MFGGSGNFGYFFKVFPHVPGFKAFNYGCHNSSVWEGKKNFQSTFWYSIPTYIRGSRTVSSKVSTF